MAQRQYTIEFEKRRRKPGGRPQFNMASCKHSNLALLPGKKNRLRCRHCHLTIKADEIENSYCPECFEIHDRKRYDFEAIEAEETKIAKYRCEECGVIIEAV